MCSKISRMEGYNVDKLSFAARVARMFSPVALIATLGAYLLLSTSSFHKDTGHPRRFIVY